MTKEERLAKYMKENPQWKPFAFESPEHKAIMQRKKAKAIRLNRRMGRAVGMRFGKKKMKLWRIAEELNVSMTTVKSDLVRANAIGR